MNKSRIVDKSTDINKNIDYIFNHNNEVKVQDYNAT